MLGGITPLFWKSLNNEHLDLGLLVVEADSCELEPPVLRPWQGPLPSLARAAFLHREKRVPQAQACPAQPSTGHGAVPGFSSVRTG